jgi:hypothetical protein
LKRVPVHVLAATAAASFVLMWVSAMPAFAFASPNPHPNPDNNGHHYGWYKHPPTPPPVPTPKPTSQPTPQSQPGTTAPGTTHGNQDPSATKPAGSDATPAAIVLPAAPQIVVVDVKADDLALWVIYLLLAGLALLWIGLVAATTVRSMTGRPAPKQA